MQIKFDKRKTAYILFAVVLFLMVSNVLIKKIFIKEPELQTISVLTPSEINKTFYNLLKNFGIDDRLIGNKEQKAKTGHQKYNYTVTVPSDLPIPVILDDVYSEFSDYGYEILSEEKEMGGKSILQISTEKDLIISAEFRYKKDIKRKKGRIGFVVNQFKIESSQDSLFFDIPESFCVLLQPSKYNSKIAGFIHRKNKEYAVLLNDNIEELDFKLKSSHSAQRIKNIVRTIVGSFSSAVFFVIDDASGFYESSAYHVVFSELQKRKIKMIKLSSFTDLQAAELTGVKESFENIVSGLPIDSQKMMLLNRDGFEHLLPSIAFFRKSGLKFINPSAIIIN